MDSQVTKRYKTFSYETDLHWTEGRIGSLASDDKPAIDVASPPEFRGVPGKWTPEHLFVASISACQMTTFLGLAARAGTPLVSYKSRARGILEFSGDGYKFTRVIVEPEIVLQTGGDLHTAHDLVEQAHALCLVARSTNAVVEVHPSITTG